MTNLDNINWLQEIENKQDELIEDLFRLLWVPSVRQDSRATKEAPLGPGPKAALDEFLRMAEEDGFETHRVGPWAGRVQIGSGDEIFGIIGHVDVVPAGSGWKTEPFEPVIVDDKIFARGASDDKGPTMAAYFALKMLRDLGVEFNKEIHLIVGTDEESGWSCMRHYLETEPRPDFGFSPDSSFPVVNGEKGNVSAKIINFAGESREADAHLASFQSGYRKNMVPAEAEAVLVMADSVGVENEFNEFLAMDQRLSGEIKVKGDRVSIRLEGQGAHGSRPALGVNAGTHLAVFLSRYIYDQEGAQDFINLLANELHENFNGQKLNIDTEHEVMGELSLNVGLIEYTQDGGGKIDVNMRFPEGIDGPTIGDRMTESLPHYNVEIEMEDARPPHFVPADDPMIQTLLNVYEEMTGEDGYTMVIGGGTFAQLMPRGVAFGALFPDSENTMHKANEYIGVQDLIKTTAIYGEAIYRLTR